ncbi:hypothetical protein ACLNGM_20260 [Aureimonas phyllosphaerae]|uniref:hypothetical protein n=1 Tax=Aureimonas phyllosphaerae TaxID=1166078 RepID=UPI003A5BAD82
MGAITEQNSARASLPAGFVLDPTPVATQTVRAPATALPEGFVLDQPAAATRSGYNPDGALGGLRTAAGGFIEGVPIIGPYLRDGAERAGAGITAAITDKTYDEALAEARALSAAEKQANPWVDTGAQIAGGIAGTAPLVAAAPAAFGMGSASVPVRAVAGGVSGGALGGIDGSVRGGVEAAAFGGGAGLFLGAAGPLVGNALRNGVSTVRTARANGAAARAVGTTREAVDVVSRGLAADGAQEGINDAITAAGPRAMLADAGPATRSILDTAIARAGPGTGDAAERINQRAAGAAKDVNEALDAGLGPSQGNFSAIRDIRDASQPARAATYDAAYATPIDYSAPQARGLETLLRRVPASVVQKANNLMRIEGVESQQILANIADDGTMTFTRMPDVRQIDYITRALNDVSRAGDGAGALGGNTAEGRAYGNLSRSIRTTTRSLVPEYGVALDTAAEPIAARQAREFGATLLRPSTARDEAEAFVSGLSDAELRNVRAGVRQQIGEVLANVKRTVTDENVDARQGILAIKELSSDAAREKLRMIVGADEAERMLSALDRAAQSFDLRGSVATNSRTYGRQAAERAVQQSNAPGVIDNAVGLSPVRSAQTFMQGVFGVSPADRLAREDRTWSALSDLLTMPLGDAQSARLSALANAARQIPRIEGQANRIGVQSSRGLAALAPQGGRLQELSERKR